MRIIIVGCGKVGRNIISELSEEGHDIVAIDKNGRSIETITNDYDVMGFVGNGTSYKVLKEAGIEETELLIAVTDSDEQNLLTCLIAKKAGNCKTIARVRNPQLSEDIGFIANELGLSMVVNPERAAAIEIARLLRFPAAVQIDTFAKGDVELIKFVIPDDSPIIGLSLSEIDKKFNGNTLICCIERNDEAIIPNGSFVINGKDKITLVSSPKMSKNFFKQIGVDIKRVKNAIIVGGSKISVYLCQALANKNIDLKIIESDPKRCEELCEILPNVSIVNGDGSLESLLKQEGITNSDAFVSLTGIDEENTFLSLFASNLKVHKVITKIDRIAYNEVINSLNLGSIIRPKNIIADNIVRYVRALSNALGDSQIETLHELIKDKIEACSFKVGKDEQIVGVPLAKLKTKGGVLIACIKRNKEIIIPNGQSVILEGDTIVVVTSLKGVKNLNDLLIDGENK